MDYAIAIDSIFFSIFVPKYEFGVDQRDPLYNFYYEYQQKHNQKNKISYRSNLLVPLTNEEKYHFLTSFRRLTLYDRLPSSIHSFLYKLKEECTINGKLCPSTLVYRLKSSPEFRNMTKKQKDFFKHKFEFKISERKFYFDSGRRRNEYPDKRAFSTSIGGLTQYGPNYLEEINSGFKWGQILFNYFGQENILVRGIHIAIDFPCEISKVKVSHKKSKTPELYGETTYYNFTKDKKSHLVVYNKAIKDRCYQACTRLEFVFSPAEFKSLELERIHYLEKKKPNNMAIDRLVKKAIKRINEFHIEVDGENFQLPSEDKLKSKISKFIKGLHGHEYNPASMCLFQQNLITSSAIFEKTLRAFKEIEQEKYLGLISGEKERDLAMELSFYDLKEMQLLIKRIYEKTVIKIETLKNKVIPFLLKNYHRVATHLDSQILENKRIISKLSVTKPGVYKYKDEKEIYIDPTLDSLLK